MLKDIVQGTLCIIERWDKKTWLFRSYLCHWRAHVNIKKYQHRVRFWQMLGVKYNQLGHEVLTQWTFHCYIQVADKTIVFGLWSFSLITLKIPQKSLVQFCVFPLHVLWWTWHVKELPREIFSNQLFLKTTRVAIDCLGDYFLDKMIAAIHWKLHGILDIRNCVHIHFRLSTEFTCCMFLHTDTSLPF